MYYNEDNKMKGGDETMKYRVRLYCFSCEKVTWHDCVRRSNSKIETQCAKCLSKKEQKI